MAFRAVFGGLKAIILPTFGGLGTLFRVLGIYRI